ncbi:hypothetical protein [Methylocapsa sp. S129]|uniref:hypothetical protein n=1 Tax=Methylocapsa sp. S129 TaxID=1641869 RepID=UPI00131B0184|nr:hypothetical protein [Methylocapsa sp. S129]
MTSISDLRKLADQLEECAQAGAGAQLSPHSTELLLGVIHTHYDSDEAARRTIVEHGFRIVAADAEGESEEILGSASDLSIARAMFDEAVRQKLDRKISLKKGSDVLDEIR